MRLLQVKYLLVDHEKPYRAARAKSIPTDDFRTICRKIENSCLFIFYIYVKFTYPLNCQAHRTLALLEMPLAAQFYQGSKALPGVDFGSYERALPDLFVYHMF